MGTGYEPVIPVSPVNYRKIIPSRRLELVNYNLHAVIRIYVELGHIHQILDLNFII